MAAGSLGAAMAAIAAGAGVSAVAAHNVVKALTQLGIPEAEASVYSDRLLQGNYLVIIEGSPDNIKSAEQVFSQQGIHYWPIYNT